jgi:hypothetical protein
MQNQNPLCGENSQKKIQQDCQSMRLTSIPIEATYFDKDDIKANTMGAGIFPVGLDKNGTIHVMLGKERYISHWKGSLKWSGFEGGRKGKESIETTASREYLEESLGVMDVIDCHGSLEHFLQTDNYVTKFILSIIHNPTDPPKYHTTYIVQVQYDEAIPHTFDAIRQALIEIQNTQSNISSYRDILRQSPLILPGGTWADDEVVVDVIQYMTTNTSLLIKLLTTKGVRAIAYHATTDLKNEMKNVFLEYMKTRYLLHKQILACLKKGFGKLIKFKTNEMGLLYDAFVVDDVVEKQSISWWRLDELKEVLKNGGYVRTEFFRAYFLPILQSAVKELNILQSKIYSDLLSATN